MIKIKSNRKAQASKVAKRRGVERKKFMEYAHLEKHLVGKNYLKYLKFHLERVSQERKIPTSLMFFLLEIYDLEFFTYDYVAESMGLGRNYIVKFYMHPLRKAGYLGVYMNNGRTKDEEKESGRGSHLKRKYCLTQAGRNFIQRFYRDLESARM